MGTVGGRFANWDGRETPNRLRAPRVASALLSSARGINNGRIEVHAFEAVRPAGRAQKFNAAAAMQSSTSAASLTRPGTAQTKFQVRESRKAALDELNRLRIAHVMNSRLAGAEQRANLSKSASHDALREQARQRDVSIARANAIKYEAEQRKLEQKFVEHAAKDRERQLAMRRVAEEKAKQHEVVAKKNQEEELRRQKMAQQIQAHEQEVRSRLAGEIVKHDLAGRLRKREIAAAKDAAIRQKAVETQAQLERAQQEKSIKEAEIIARIKADASMKAEAREERVAKAKAVKEVQYAEYAKRNAEEEERRVKALELIQQREAQEALKLAAEVVRNEEHAKRRISSAAVHRLKEVAEAAEARKKQAERAIEIKANKERREREIQLAAAAEMEKKREARLKKAAELKEAQRLYYVQRNAMEEVRYHKQPARSQQAASKQLVHLSARPLPHSLTLLPSPSHTHAGEVRAEGRDVVCRGDGSVHKDGEPSDQLRVEPRQVGEPDDELSDAVREDARRFGWRARERCGGLVAARGP